MTEYRIGKIVIVIYLMFSSNFKISKYNLSVHNVGL